MSEEDGGLVAELIKKFKMAIFKCDCGQVIDTPNFEGYTHEGGFQDKTGTKWWLFVKCTNCDYDWAINKIEQQAKKLQRYNDTVGRFDLFYDEVVTIHQGKLKKGLPNIGNSMCNIYSIGYTGNRVICTPIIVMDGSHSPMDHVKDVVDKLQPACYVVVVEAWQSTAIDLKSIKPGDAEKDPNRREVLWIAGRSKEGGFNKQNTWQMFRDKIGNVKKFENLGQTTISQKLP